MKSVFDKASTFKKIIDSIKDVTKETNINICEETGWTIQAMDSSHVSLVQLSIKDSLSEFNCVRAEVIALNMETLSKMLRLCDNDAALELSTKDNKLNITSCRDARKIDFQQNLMDIEMENFDLPEMEYPISIKMPTAEFTRLVRDMKEFGDNLVVRVTKENVKFIVEGDAGSGCVTVEPSATVKLEVEECLEVTLGLKFLALFSKASPLCDEMVWQFGEGMPSCTTFQIGSVDKLAFYLAPKCD